MSVNGKQDYFGLKIYKIYVLMVNARPMDKRYCKI